MTRAAKGIRDALASIERLRIIRAKAEALKGGAVHEDAVRLCRETDAEIAAVQETLALWRQMAMTTN